MQEFGAFASEDPDGAQWTSGSYPAEVPHCGGRSFMEEFVSLCVAGLMMESTEFAPQGRCRIAGDRRNQVLDDPLLPNKVVRSQHAVNMRDARCTN